MPFPLLPPLPLQNCPDGFYYFAHRKLLTVFSATNYCGEMNNNGAMMALDEHVSAYLEVCAPRQPPAGCSPALRCVRSWGHQPSARNAGT